MNPYYENDFVVIYNGDCLQVLEENSFDKFDAIICDPPYGTTMCKWDSVIPLDRMWKAIKLVSRNTTPVVLFSAQPFTSTLLMSNLREYKYEWIWEKTHPTGHLNAKKAPLRSHENLLVFYNNQPTYNPQKTNGHTRKTAIKKADYSPVYNSQKFVSLPYDSTERYPRDVLLFPSDKQLSTLHPTQKPLDLLRYLIRTYTNEGEIVLDFSSGSGTTLLAAQMENRKAVGIEIDERYCELSVDRLNAVVLNGKVVVV